MSASPLAETAEAHGEHKIEFDPATVTWVLDDADRDRLHAAIQSGLEVVIDLETTGLFEYATTGGTLNGGVAGRISLASLTIPQADDPIGPGGIPIPITWVVPLSHPSSPFVGKWSSVVREMCTVIWASKVPLVNHNLKFDLRWLYAFSEIDLTEQAQWDTQISSHLLDETTSTKLKERAPLTFGVPRWDDFDLSIPGASERVPLFDLGLYAARDTFWTWMLGQHHRNIMFVADREGEVPVGAEEVSDARLGRVATWCAVPSVRSLAAIEQRGMALDREWSFEKIEELEGVKATTYARLAGRYGGQFREMSFAPTSHSFRAWTAAAVEAGDLRIASMTAKGNPQWSKGVLTRQARNWDREDDDNVPELILQHRQAVKRLEYLRSWLDYCGEDGVIHATYNAGSVVTGRLSSSSPNMQQVTASLKPAWVPRPGYVFADFDYSQIELRVAAFISRSEPMMEAFINDLDLHTILAAQVTGKAEADVTPWERQGGKAGNFGFLFGMGAGGFQEYAETQYGVSFTIEECERIYEAFFETWTGLREWHHRTVAKVRHQGYVSSPIGRVRRLPGIWDSNPKMQAFCERAAINSPVQGFASDIMQIAAATIQGLIPGTKGVPGALPVGTVHDSLLLELPEDDWESYAEECRDRMVNMRPFLRDRLECDFDVPLKVEVKIGTRWGLTDVGTMK